MEKINYSFIISLEEICFRRVAIILWTRPCTVTSFHAYAIEEEVIEDMRKLKLPILLAEQMIYVVEPIQLDIFDWIDFHVTHLGSSFEYSDQYILFLCWTNLGTIDYRKSAEKLIKYKISDVIQCYKLACLYCLDDYTSVLWDKLSEESKICFYKETGPLPDAEPSLEFCWPYILKGEETKLNNVLKGPLGNLTTFNQYAFEYSAHRGMKSAAEYFFRKLTEAAREVSPFRTVQTILERQSRIFIDVNETPSRHARSHTFWYLLSLMSPEQQLEIFKEYPYQVLLNFLIWPWQDIPLNMAELIWPYLTESDYTNVLEIISLRIKSRFNLSKLFQKLFLHGTSDFRKYFVERECQSGISFRSFFKVEDSETIKIIFRAVDSSDRKRLVFSERVLKHFHKSILRENCGMAQLCLREATLCDEDKEELKGTFYKFFTETEREEKDKTRNSRTFGELRPWREGEEAQNLYPSPSLTSFEIEERYINRGEYIWQQFLQLVDEDDAGNSDAMILDEEDMVCPSSDSDLDFI